MSTQLFLVELELLLEGRELVNHLFLGILELLDQQATFRFCLLNAKLEVLPLGLENLGQLVLLLPELLTLPLKLSHCFTILRLLCAKLTKEGIIELVVPILPLICVLFVPKVFTHASESWGIWRHHVGSHPSKCRAIDIGPYHALNLIC